MDNSKTLNHYLAVTAWGFLFVWWGLVIIIDPLTIGIGAIGTGLIFLGANIVRLAKGISPRESNYRFAAMAILWGVLDQARFMLGLPPWLSFGFFFIIIGLNFMLAPVFARLKLNSGDV